MSGQNAKRLALGASLFFAALGMRGQSNTFDVVHYNVSSGFATGHSVRETPNGYLVFGVQTQLDTTRQDCSVSRFDVEGGFSSEYYLSHSRFESFGNDSDPISTVPWSIGFIGGWGTYLGAEPLDTVWAVRFNSVGDTLWTKPLLIDTIVYARKALAKGGKFYFTGLEASGVLLGNSAYVIRTDTSANIELTHLSGDLDPNSMDVDSSGNMYVAGTRNYKGYMIKVDSAGNQEWQRFQPKPQGNWYGVKHLFGDKLLCMGSWYVHPLPFPDTTWMYLSMYDEGGNLQWQYQGLKGKAGYQNAAMFTDGYQDSDSTFIVCGAIQQLYWNRAVIYRFTDGGTPLWRRDYAHFSNLTTNYPQIPWDIEPTSDGGMVLTGEAWDHDTVPPLSDVNMWLLKLDSMGCLVPGCQYVGINEVAYGLEHALKVWPNPSDGRVNLALDLPEGLPLEGNLLLQVFDAGGRQVVRKNIGSQLAQTIALDLSGQPPGLYSAHISDARRILTGAKMIIR